MTVLGLFAIFAVTTPALAGTASCFQWEFHTGGLEHNTGWVTDPAVLPATIAAAIVDNTLHGCGMGSTWPYSSCSIHLDSAFPAYTASGSCARVSGGTIPFSCGVIGRRANPDGCQVYTSDQQDPPANCGPSCVGDPINPSSGAAIGSEANLGAAPAGTEFLTFHNTANSASGALGAGWSSQYSRRITPRYSSSKSRPYVTSADNSSLYTDEATACTSGFAQIKSRVGNWVSASAGYSNGRCAVSVGSTVIAELPILYTSTPTPAPGTQILLGFDAIRDDGSVYGFALNGMTVSAPLGMGMKLQQTGSGYLLTDTNDTVEAYDTNGKLLSVTARGGIAQTMSYDSAGRLSTVVDSFGHKLTLTYDGQNRLSTVTRQ
jgi:YD repeat-containing protein